MRYQNEPNSRQEVLNERSGAGSHRPGAGSSPAASAFEPSRVGGRASSVGFVSRARAHGRTRTRADQPIRCARSRGPSPGSGAVGSAPALGAGGRGFESPLPDQELPGQRLARVQLTRLTDRLVNRLSTHDAPVTVLSPTSSNSPTTPTRSLGGSTRRSRRSSCPGSACTTPDTPRHRSPVP